MKIDDLILYKEYKLSELAEAFENGSFIYGGGMIYTVKNNTLVLISKHTPDAIYQDEPKDGKYIYTGMGQVGDQTITLGNKRLVNAKRDNTNVYLFITYAPNKFEYYGKVELNDAYYFDLEKDVKGNNRKVLKFPLSFIDAKLMPMSQTALKKTVSAGLAPVLRVVGACISDGEKYLITQRSKKQSYEGKWEFPGGKVEPGETDQEALAREIKEELGLDIKVSDLLDDSTFYEKDKNRIIHLYVYNSSILTGTPTPKEDQHVEWKDIDELDNLDWANNDIPIAQTLIDKAPRKIVDVVNYLYKERKKKTPKASEIKRECQDYEKSQKKKAKAGNEAELAVINYEANKLNELGRIDLIPKIKQVSKISSDYGYDILSYEFFEGKMNEIHIEVKSARLVGENIEFFISQAELRNCIDDNNYKIYALLRYGRNYKLHIIKREEFISDNRYLSPISYKVSIPVEEF